MTVVDLFAGPGGVDEGLASIGVADVVGIEWDADACATAKAAGHRRVHADVSALDPLDYPCDGLWASPPCQAWSMAGHRSAHADQARLGQHVEACRGGWTSYDPSDYADARTPLVLEPLRWADALRPRWLVCEQVPPVADLWAHYGDVLRGWGYHAWAGVLRAEEFGVPQTRQRAFLIARLDAPAAPPEPTHTRYDPTKPDYGRTPPPAGLFGGELAPWVAMADALDWGPTEAPSPTIAPGKDVDGGNRYRERVVDRGDRGWQFVAAGETGSSGSRGRPSHPAATLGTKVAVDPVGGAQEKSAVRSTDEPAPTVHFGHRINEVRWVHERPATTVACDARVHPPGHKENSSDPEGKYEQRRGGNAVRVTVAEAAALQGFPPDYPWRGSKTSQFSQVGNAVPPPLAAAVCRLFQESEGRGPQDGPRR